jgi:flagellar biosynthesis protein FlhF
MKIVRHTAPDIRTALRAIREQLGEEAVILSSHRTAQGVEITAAIDFDAGKLEAAVAAPLAAREEAESGSPIPSGRSPPESARTAAARGAAMIEEEPPGEASTQAMGRELQSLRRMLETQLAQLAWNDRTRRAPVHTELLRELTEIGIARDLADHLVGQLDARIDLTQGRRFAIAGLSQYLLVTGDRWLESGGRVAFVGATGVGKTTVLAKLAVRWILRHGTRDLALVASDNARIGAQDQMQALGQLLGVPVHVPDRFEALPELISRLGHYRMVLIDTPGSSLRDAQLDARLAVLANCASRLETALVLAASTQAGALEEAVQRFRPANPASCLLTKMDEAASLGGALSVLIRARLPLAYTSDGQRVPEDLRPARSLELVSHAVRLARATGAAADEDLLRRRFGRLAHG